MDHDLPRPLHADPARARGRRRAWTRRSSCSRAPTPRAARAEAFERALADFLADRDGAPRRDALDLTAAYGVDRVRRMVSDVHDELRSRGQTAPVLPRPRPADLDAAQARAAPPRRPPPPAELAGARSLPTIDAARERRSPRGLRRGPAASPSSRRAALDEYRAARAARTRAALRRRPGAAPAVALLGELLEGYAAAYAAAKRARSGVDYDDLELLTRDLLRPRAGHRRRLRRALRADHGRRVPGHEPAADAAAGAPGARERVHRRRRAAVDLRLPPRRRRGLPRPPRRARAPGRRRHAGDELPRPARDPRGARRAPTRAEHERWEPLRAGRTDPPGARAADRAADHRRRRVGRGRARRARRRAARGRPGQAGRGAARRPAGRRARARRRLRRRRRRDPHARRDRHGPLRAGPAPAGALDARRGRARLVGAPADPGPVRLPRGAGQPARRRGAARAAGLAAGRARRRTRSRCWRSPAARRGGGPWDALVRSGRDPRARGRRRPAGRVPRLVRRGARARAAARARRAAGPRRRAHRLRPARPRAARRRRGAWRTSIA